jgi:hypothetical protein
MDSTKPETTGGFSVQDALDMFERYQTYWAENYREAKIDLNFSMGIDQWDEADVRARKEAGKPSMVSNELPQFIHQVTNDIRQNTPSIKVLPEADGDVETAEIFSGLVRSIEYKSAADAAYDIAADNAVRCGIGFIRADHDYCDDDSDEQELKILSVPDSLSGFIDPDSVEYDGRDSNGQIFLETINKKTFERLYPKKEFVSFTDPKSEESKDNIVIAEILIREWTGARGKKAIIHRYKFSGTQKLAETTFPGDYIPAVPVYGEVVWVNGKRMVASLIRQARDAQKRVNFLVSKEAELLAMAPIAPVMAAQGTLINDRQQWQKPGSEMILEYSQTDINDQPAPPPTRLMPPQASSAITDSLVNAKQSIKEILGLYNASIGQRSNETSGVAIDARKHEGDVATFHFPDNVRRSINQLGTILVCAIPTIYDTQRIIQIVNEETDVKMVGVNGAAIQDGQSQAYDLTKGKYHVRVTTGASFTTKRQEGAAMMGDVIKQNPELMQVIGDLWAKNLDIPGSDAMASRLKKMVPPNLQDDQSQQDPQVMAMQAKMQEMQQLIQQGGQQIQQLEAELQNKQGDQQLKAAELEVKKQELAVKQAELQVKQAELQQPVMADTDIQDSQLKEREMQLKEAEFQLKVAQAQMAQLQTPEKGDDMGAGESVEMLQAKLQQKMQEKQQQEDTVKQQQEQAAQQQEQEQMKTQQSQMLLETLGVIAQQLNGLMEQVARPKTVMRDDSGAIVGIH